MRKAGGLGHDRGLGDALADDDEVDVGRATPMATAACSMPRCGDRPPRASTRPRASAGRPSCLWKRRSGGSGGSYGRGPVEHEGHGSTERPFEVSGVRLVDGDDGVGGLCPGSLAAGQQPPPRTGQEREPGALEMDVARVVDDPAAVAPLGGAGRPGSVISPSDCQMSTESGGTTGSSAGRRWRSPTRASGAGIGRPVPPARPCRERGREGAAGPRRLSRSNGVRCRFPSPARGSGGAGSQASGRGWCDPVTTR